MAQNANQGITRSVRALTLQGAPSSRDKKDSDAGALERHTHFRYHRPHRSHQITSREVQAANQPSHAPRTDLLNPIKSTAASLTGFGSRNASSNAFQKILSRDPSRERGGIKEEKKEWSWDDFKRMQAENKKREKSACSHAKDPISVTDAWL